MDTADDARLYADVAEMFGCYDVEAFYALPPETQAMLWRQAGRVRRRREAEAARATYFGVRAALGQVYPELAE